VFLRKVRRGSQVYQGLGGLKASGVLMEDLVQRESLGCQVLVDKDCQAQKENQVFQENQEFQEYQGRKVLQECQASQDLKETQ
jgi:hypothetical protein